MSEPKITISTIQRCASSIRDYMDRQSLAPYLFEHALLTDDEMYHFCDEKRSPGESNTYLIERLKAKGRDSAQKFYQCLQMEPQHLGHSQIVEDLKKAALQDTMPSCKDAEEINEISYPDDNSEKEPKFSLKDLEEKYQKAIRGGFTQLRYDELSAQQKEILGEVQAMLIVVNDSEFMATMSYLKPPQNQKILKIHRNIKLGHDNNNPLIFYIGMFGKCLVAVTRVDQGCGRDALIHSDCFENVLLIAAVGVAAGFPENGVKFGDVLVSQQITDCAIYKRQDGEYISRGNTTRAFKYLIKRLKDGKFQWKFVCASQDTKSSVIFGQFLSKPMLLNDEAERGEILKYFGKEAKGYEMEGFSIAGGAIDCIIIKGVCDFATGKNKKWQPTAALAANDCLYHDLNQMDLSVMKDDIQKGGHHGGRKQTAASAEATVTATAAKGTAANEKDASDLKRKQKNSSSSNGEHKKRRMCDEEIDGLVVPIDNDEGDAADPVGGKSQQQSAESMHSQLNADDAETDGGTICKQPVGSNAKEFTEEDIKKATETFSESRKLGGGGFGLVYRGCINGTSVAVKKLTKNIAAAEAGMKIPDKFSIDGQLNCEMWALERCRHKNLVALVGYCSKPPILIYEFMERGDLYDQMFKKKTPIDWSQRSNILKDVCCGLTWLHGMTPPMIHGDVKMTNILLDKHLSAKLGDLGFAKEISKVVGNRSFITTKLVAKTLGYSPPEMDTGKISPKGDVYSYGVVALELFTGLEAYSKEREDPKLTDHLEDERKTLEGYGTIADKAPGDLKPHSLGLFKEIIEGCLRRYGKRLESNQVMEAWEKIQF